MQSLKLTWVDLLLLYSYLVVVCMTLQAGRALNIHLIYYRVDKITIAYDVSDFQERHGISGVTIVFLLL